MSYQPKIALVHDDFSQHGGAERLFTTIASLYPDAPIFTSLVDWNKLPSKINRNKIRTSFMQKIPFACKIFKALLPLYPLAFESFNFDGYDLVLSSTTRFAKAIITKPNTVHVVYLNSVPRFLYNEAVLSQYLPGFLRFLIKPYFAWLKRWDQASAARVDFFIANSKNVQQKIKKIYNRQSAVVYPSADTQFFIPQKPISPNTQNPDYFLIVSRLVKWKGIDIAIKACLDLNIELKIIGMGPDKERLKRLASSKPGHPEFSSGSSEILNRVYTERSERVQNDKDEIIQFLGNVTKEELRSLYQNCKALIVTQEEDFGIAAVEAQACGKPVIAYQRGGVKEIIVEGSTGSTYKDQTPASLKDAMRASSKVKWDRAVCRKNALRFSMSHFKKQLETTLANYAKFNRWP